MWVLDKQRVILIGVDRKTVDSEFTAPSAMDNKTGFRECCLALGPPTLPFPRLPGAPVREWYLP